MRKRGKSRPVLTYSEGRAKLRDYAEVIPKCPTCGRQATIDRSPRGVRASCCGLWSWGYRPLADRATHAARQRAHVAFDWLWTYGGLARSAAYARLATEMGLSLDECHMSLMDLDRAEAVPEAVDRIKAQMRLQASCAKTPGGRRDPTENNL